MDSLQFKKEYSIHVYETGPGGRLNLYSLFDYMQDIAADHAVKLGFGRDDLMRDNRFWVLSRMYAEITELPLWGETITITTRPNGTDKLFALRNYDVRSNDGRLIAAATSSWLILDQTTRRVQRPDSILSRYNPNLHNTNSPVRYASKLEPSPEEGTSSNPFRVNVSDLDVNHHTNNVRYLKWVSDSYSLDFVINYVPRSVEINYLAESLFGEDIVIKSYNEKEPGFHNHSIFRTNDNKELCRIRLDWKEINRK